MNTSASQQGGRAHRQTHRERQIHTYTHIHQDGNSCQVCRVVNHVWRLKT